MTTSRLLALGVVVAFGVGAGCGGDEEADDRSPASPASRNGAVSIDGNAYEPEAVTIAVGEQVEWVNDDSATHTVTADDGATFDSDQLAEGDSFRHRFDERGEFAYTCEIHPFMHGTVTVE